jgi:glycosyltransferase involved in cell wall biosynthesis
MVIKKIVNLLYKMAFKLNVKVFFQNQDDKELFVKNKLVDQNKALLVNGSGVDLNYYAKADVPAEPVFLMVARFIREKGIVEYFKAVDIVKQKYPATRFLLVGYLEAGNPGAISASELEYWLHKTKIEYFGELSDVRDVLRHCSVYVLPSYREGLPRSVLEAMSMGRAIITTDAPGCRSTVIDGENGFVVPVKNVEKLAEAMVKFIDSPILLERMGAYSRVLAEEKFDAVKVNETIFSVLTHNQ